MNNQQWKLSTCIQQLLLFILLIEGITLFSQNLIPDSSFEKNNRIPIMYSEIGASKYWSRPSLGTSDLYCKCSRKQSKYSLVNVPNNPMGSQNAHSGVCYAGIFAHSHGSYREYLQTELKETLEANAVYLITAYISLADYSRASINKFGAAFSKKRVKHTSTGIITHVNVNYFKTDSTSLRDTTKWQQINLEYKAVGGENFIILGSFEVNTTEKTMVMAPKEAHTRINQSTHRDAYYYLDDICLRKIRDEPAITEDWIESYETKPDTATQRNYTITSILFESNNYLIKEVYKIQLDRLVTFLKTNTSFCLQIEGHTDKTGSKKANQILSEKRAFEVYNYFLRNKIEPSRLTWRGLSASKPTSAKEIDGLKMNRRVEIQLIERRLK